MLFYIWTIGIPIFIISILYTFSRNKPHKLTEYPRFLMASLSYLFLYGFLLYFLEMENIVSGGWIFVTFMFFLIPIAAIIILINFFLRIKNR